MDRVGHCDEFMEGGELPPVKSIPGHQVVCFSPRSSFSVVSGVHMYLVGKLLAPVH